MIKKHLLGSLVVLGGLCVVVPLQSFAVTLVGEAQVQIVRPISVKLIRTLNFGLLKGGYRPGAVTITVNNRRIAGGGAWLLPGAFHSPGRFEIHGTPGARYSLDMPDEVSATLSKKFWPVHWLKNDKQPNGDTPMASHFKTFLKNGQHVAREGQLNRQGKDRMILGATLSLPAHAPAGIYKATVPVTVSYQ